MLNSLIFFLELFEVMTSLGDVLSEVETEELIAEADIDGDGNINYEEFVEMLFREVGHLSMSSLETVLYCTLDVLNQNYLILGLRFIWEKGEFFF